MLSEIQCSSIIQIKGRNKRPLLTIESNQFCACKVKHPIPEFLILEVIFISNYWIKNLQPDK